MFAIAGTAARRWYVVVPVVAISLYLGWSSYQSVPAAYTGSMSIVVLPSLPNPTTADGNSSDPENEHPNPFSSGGSRFVAAVLARNINSSAFRVRLEVVGQGATFEASASEQQPIIRIDASASSPDEVVQVLDSVAGEAASVLSEFQQAAGASEDNLYRSATAVPIGEVVDATPNRYRTGIAIVVIGLIIGAGLAVAVDALTSATQLRNKRRHSERPSAPDPEMATSETPPSPHGGLDESSSEPGNASGRHRTANPISIGN